MTRQYKRLNDITVLSSFAIILVVLGHCLIFMSDHTLATAPFEFIHNFIYSFHMPLFMAIAGYLFIHTNIAGGIGHYGSFVAKKARRLLLPYFVISSIAYIPKTFFSRYAFRPAALGIDEYLRGLLYPLQNPIINFWFLPTLFMVFVIVGMAGRRLSALKDVRIAMAVTALTVVPYLVPALSRIEILNISGALKYLIYFWLGCVVCLYREEMRFIDKRWFLAATLAILVAAQMVSDPPRYLRILVAMAGILFSFSFCNLLVTRGVRFTGFIDGYSYQIYLLSWFFETFSRIVFFQVAGLNYYLVMAVIFTSGLLGPVIVARFVKERLPRMRGILGM